MIQRVQSVWLFLASMTMLLLLLLPILSNETNNAELWFQVGGIYQKINKVTQQTESFPALFGATILVGLFCLANIFNFKNRTLQKRIIILIILFILGLEAGMFYYAQEMPGGLEGVTYNAGAYLPLLSILFCVLAYRGIRKDEQLIRSADRLR